MKEQCSKCGSFNTYYTTGGINCNDCFYPIGITNINIDNEITEEDMSKIHKKTFKTNLI